MVAFIYLDFFEEENSYEIAFGKMSWSIDFIKILIEFLNEYKDNKRIFALVESTNPNRKRVYDTLEKAGFEYNLEDCAGNERQYVPLRNSFLS